MLDDTNKKGLDNTRTMEHKRLVKYKRNFKRMKPKIYPQELKKVETPAKKKWKKDETPLSKRNFYMKINLTR